MKLLLVAACLAMASATVIKDDNLFNFVIGKESLGKKLLGYRKNAINNSMTHKIFKKKSWKLFNPYNFFKFNNSIFTKQSS